jgi:hypothetical protein
VVAGIQALFSIVKRQCYLPRQKSTEAREGNKGRREPRSTRTTRKGGIRFRQANGGKRIAAEVQRTTPHVVAYNGPGSVKRGSTRHLVPDKAAEVVLSSCVFTGMMIGAQALSIP